MLVLSRYTVSCVIPVDIILISMYHMYLLHPKSYVFYIDIGATAVEFVCFLNSSVLSIMSAIERGLIKLCLMSMH